MSTPLRDAAYAALVYLTNATSDEFAKGSDREVRRQLVEALGYNWTEYDRGNVNVSGAGKNLNNQTATEGCSRCECGCKYWENDRCIDCGTIHNAERHDDP